MQEITIMPLVQFNTVERTRKNVIMRHNINVRKNDNCLYFAAYKCIERTNVSFLPIQSE